MFERTTQTVSWKFTAHLIVVLLNKHNLETKTGITTAEIYACVVVLGAEIYNWSEKMSLSWIQSAVH